MCSVYRIWRSDLGEGTENTHGDIVRPKGEIPAAMLRATTLYTATHTRLNRICRCVSFAAFRSRTTALSDELTMVTEAPVVGTAPS